MYFEGVPFLARPYSLGLAMNIDWFQPYTWTKSSVGAVYLSVLNLPYHHRFKREFVILAGIIPGPREPKRDILTYVLFLENFKTCGMESPCLCLVKIKNRI